MFNKKVEKHLILLEHFTNNFFQVVKLYKEIITRTKNYYIQLKRIKELKVIGDELYIQIVFELHKVFITSIDREDVLLLIQRISWFIGDLINSCSFLTFHGGELDIRLLTAKGETMHKATLYIIDAVKSIVQKEFHNNYNLLKELHNCTAEGEELFAQEQLRIYGTNNNRKLMTTNQKEIIEIFRRQLQNIMEIIQVIERIYIKN